MNSFIVSKSVPTQEVRDTNKQLIIVSSPLTSLYKRKLKPFIIDKRFLSIVRGLRLISGSDLAIIYKIQRKNIPGHSISEMDTYIIKSAYFCKKMNKLLLLNNSMERTTW